MNYRFTYNIMYQATRWILAYDSWSVFENLICWQILDLINHMKVEESLYLMTEWTFWANDYRIRKENFSVHSTDTCLLHTIWYELHNTPCLKFILVNAASFQFLLRLRARDCSSRLLSSSVGKNWDRKLSISSCLSHWFFPLWTLRKPLADDA